jgi:hypothetical protein
MLQLAGIISLGWGIAGTVGQLMLGAFLIMFVIFSGAGIANNHTPVKFQTGILNFLIIGLPFLCFISACIVLYLYHTNSSAFSYWWYFVPLMVAALYLIYAVYLNI